MNSSRIIQINSPSDPRIAAYLNMKERELARQGGQFIAEGELVVKRLLKSNFGVESLLLADRRLEEIEPLVPGGVPIFVGSPQLVNQIVGFKFHAGVMACGLRGESPTILGLARNWRDENVTLVVCPELSNTENLGSMIRIAAAFGATAMILGERSCDPFFRQSVRVSMGSAFFLPIVRSEDLKADLELLKERDVELIATTLSIDAEPLAKARRARRIAILFGNEAQGLGEEHIKQCDRAVTIPMLNQTDSLNVSIAAGIVLYHFTQYASVMARQEPGL